MSRGIELTDSVIEKLAGEAEAGYDAKRLKRRRGRPSIGSEAASVFQVRLEPELREALGRRAEAEHTTPSELTRRLLRRELLEGPRRKRSR